MRLFAQHAKSTVVRQLPERRCFCEGKLRVHVQGTVVLLGAVGGAHMQGVLTRYKLLLPCYDVLFSTFFGVEC